MPRGQIMLSESWPLCQIISYPRLFAGKCRERAAVSSLAVRLDSPMCPQKNLGGQVELSRALLKLTPEWLVGFGSKSLNVPVWVCGRARRSLGKQGAFLILVAVTTQRSLMSIFFQLEKKNKKKTRHLNMKVAKNIHRRRERSLFLRLWQERRAKDRVGRKSSSWEGMESLHLSFKYILEIDSLYKPVLIFKWGFFFPLLLFSTWKTLPVKRNSSGNEPLFWKPKKGGPLL